MIKTSLPKTHKHLQLSFSKDKLLNEDFSAFKSQNEVKILTSRHIKSQKNFFPTGKLRIISPKVMTSQVLFPITNTNRIQRPQSKTQTVNFVQQQPKRPKILNRLRHAVSLGFNDEFKMGKVLGKGRFGNVCLAKHTLTHSLFAVKKIGLQKMSNRLLERIIAQIKIQFFLNHENCLQLYKFYKENDSIILILEVGDQSLFDLLRQRRFFTERETSYYIRQTIQALRHLHSHGVIHRDIKPQNIVLVNNVVKLADFGWSIYTSKTQKRKTFCGTLDYVCPEIVLGSEYDEMVDVWSVGVLCYELCTGHAPFESNRSRQETYRKILTVDLKFPRHLSAEARDFIGRLLVRVPSSRMSLEQALQHPWMKQYEKKQQDNIVPLEKYHSNYSQ